MNNYTKSIWVLALRNGSFDRCISLSTCLESSLESQPLSSVKRQCLKQNPKWHMQASGLESPPLRVGIALWIISVIYLL